MPTKTDPTILQAALIGYQAELGRIDAAMDAIRSQLNGKTTHSSPAGIGPKRVMSAAARKRIAEAQKKRWALFHSKHSAPARKTGPKRKLSPAAKAKLAANLAKARAAKAAKARAAAA